MSADRARIRQPDVYTQVACRLRARRSQAKLVLISILTTVCGGGAFTMALLMICGKA